MQLTHNHKENTPVFPALYNFYNTFILFISSIPVIMAKYSDNYLIIKSLLMHSVLKRLAIPYLTRVYYLNVLMVISILNKRRLPADLYTVAFCMGANCRNSSRSAAIKTIIAFKEVGYLSGNTRFKITELGERHLATINEALNLVTIRITTKDSLFIKPAVAKKARKPRVTADL